MPSTNQPEIKTPAIMSSSTSSDPSERKDDIWCCKEMAENHVLPGTTDDDKYSQPEKPTACIGGQRKGKRVYHNGYGRAAPCITFTGNRQAKKEFAKVKFRAVF